MAKRRLVSLMPEAARQFFKVVEISVFGVEYDGALRNSLKSSTSAKEALEEGALANALADIQKVIEAASSSINATSDARSADASAEIPMVERRHKLALSVGHTKAIMTIQKMDEADEQRLESFQREALSRVDEGTEIIVEEDTVKSMAEKLRNTAFGKATGVPSPTGGYVVVVYFPKQAGECTTQPGSRTPPLRNNAAQPGGAHYKRLLTAVMQSRFPAEDLAAGRELEIHAGDCFLVSDGGKHGNQASLMSPWLSGGDNRKGITKVSKTLFIQYDEDSLMQQKDKARGALTIDQTEQLYFVTASQLQRKRTTRLRHAGTTAGTGISSVQAPNVHDRTAQWHLTVGEKKEMYAGGARMLPGGPQDGAEKGCDRSPPVLRKDTDLEPSCFHASSKSFLEELLFQVGDKGQLRAVVDLSPTDDKLGMICLEQHIPYMAVCYSEKHAELLKHRLQKMVWSAFLEYGDGKNPLYRSEVAKLMQDTQEQA